MADHTGGRTVYLPLERSEKCSKCGTKDRKLRICTACAEALYCSQECQKSDWKSHKVQCGETDRVDLRSFYPLIACLVETSHCSNNVPSHPALTHKIINTPNPRTNITGFPDGTAAQMILLGEELKDLDMGGDKWWSTAMSPQVRAKLFRRIATEGHLLPILLAICIALVGEMYTTTAIPRSETPSWQVTERRRVRLSYKTSPITDFGIVKGSVRVTNQDQFAYYNLEKNHFMKGQNPKDHYWLYFSTLAGDELYLECGMFTFNFCMTVNPSGYTRHLQLPPQGKMGDVPAYFYDGEHQQQMPHVGAHLWRAERKFSILRDSNVPSVVSDTVYDYCACHDQPKVHSLMERIAGRPCSQKDKELVMAFLAFNSMVLRLTMKDREYLRYPESPIIGIAPDPDETVAEPDDDDASFAIFVKKWARRYKRGKATPEQIQKALAAWEESPHDVRMKMAHKKEA